MSCTPSPWSPIQDCELQASLGNLRLCLRINNSFQTRLGQNSEIPSQKTNQTLNLRQYFKLTVSPKLTNRSGIVCTLKSQEKAPPVLKTLRVDQARECTRVAQNIMGLDHVSFSNTQSQCVTRQSSDHQVMLWNVLQLPPAQKLGMSPDSTLGVLQILTCCLR